MPRSTNQASGRASRAATPRCGGSVRSHTAGSIASTPPERDRACAAPRRPSPAAARGAGGHRRRPQWPRVWSRAVRSPAPSVAAPAELHARVFDHTEHACFIVRFGARAHDTQHLHRDETVHEGAILGAELPLTDDKERRAELMSEALHRYVIDPHDTAKIVQHGPLTPANIMMPTMYQEAPTRNRPRTRLEP